MSWPLGYARPSLHLQAGIDGRIAANGVVVTQPNGWLDVPLPATARVRGAPDDISVRLRLALDDQGFPFLYIEQVEVAGRRFNSLEALVLEEGVRWVAPLTRAIHGEIAHRAAGGVFYDRPDASRTPTRNLRAVTGKEPVPGTVAPGPSDASGIGHPSAS